MKYQIKYALSFIIFFLFITNSFSQTAANTLPASDFNFSLNTTLCYIAVVLLFVIIILARTASQAISFYKHNEKPISKSNNIKPIAVFVGLLILSQLAFSQETKVVIIDNSAKQMSQIYLFSFVVIIIMEIAIILFLIKAIRYLTGIEQQQKVISEQKALKKKMSEINYLEEEKELDTGHCYDGIRELDNVIPPWFTAAFVACIVFAIVYLYRYEVAYSAPDQFEEFETEMRTAKLIQDSLLRLEGNTIDENSVVLLTGSNIDVGRGLYMSSCSACHGDKGQGSVGANLTDEFWLHQGSVSAIFKSIKYGWADKGMQAWKDNFSGKQIAQLTSYVKSLKGTNPPNQKEKQGDFYAEKPVVIVADSVVVFISK